MSKEKKGNNISKEIISLKEKIQSLENVVGTDTSLFMEEVKESVKQIRENKLLAENYTESLLKSKEEGANALLQISNDSKRIAEDEAKIEGIREKVVVIQTAIEEMNGDAKSKASLILAEYAKVQSSANSVEEVLQKFEDLIKSIPGYQENILQVEQFYTKGNESDSKISALYKSITDKHKEIETVYYQIFGQSIKNENGEVSQIKGRKDELDESYNSIKIKLKELEVDLNKRIELLKKEFDKNVVAVGGKLEEFTKNGQASYDEIISRIERLLPNALTAGLSSAYSEKKVNEVVEGERHTKAFKGAILGLITISLIPFFVSVVSIYHNEDLKTVIFRIPRLVIAILPLYIPVLWLAYSSNKKMNLSKRLVEEYSHKEVLSKTFEGLSKQIENITDKGTSAELMNKLLFNILEVNSENPGKLISDYNKSDHPVVDALEKSVKLTNAVAKLANLPGFTKLASILEKRSQRIIEGEETKANAGLDSLEGEKL